MASPSDTPVPSRSAAHADGVRVDVLGMTSCEFGDRASSWFGSCKGAGIARAVWREAVRTGSWSPEAHGAGARAAAIWRRHCTVQLPEVAATVSEAGDQGPIEKRQLRLADGRTIESVSLPMGRGRSSLCVSTQVGCARACTFCETGRMGLLRNLTTAEIVAQVTLQWREQPPTSIVFQGMGEPLDNLDGLLPALAVLTDRHGFAFAQERLTVCTVGHVPGIEALRRLGYKRLNLSLSLNSADDRRRAELMPHSVRYTLREIQQALIAFRQRKNLALGLHWCLLPGINDTAADADGLAAFAAPLGRTLVHVIPYNPGSAPIARPPSEADIQRFVALLRDRGLHVRRRITKGRSVMAACGQLGA